MKPEYPAKPIDPRPPIDPGDDPDLDTEYDYEFAEDDQFGRDSILAFYAPILHNMALGLDAKPFDTDWLDWPKARTVMPRYIGEIIGSLESFMRSTQVKINDSDARLVLEAHVRDTILAGLERQMIIKPRDDGRIYLMTKAYDDKQRLLRLTARSKEMAVSVMDCAKEIKAVLDEIKSMAESDNYDGFADRRKRAMVLLGELDDREEFLNGIRKDYLSEMQACEGDSLMAQQFSLENDNLEEYPF